MSKYLAMPSYSLAEACVTIVFSTSEEEEDPSVSRTVGSRSARPLGDGFAPVDREPIQVVGTGEVLTQEEVDVLLGKGDRDPQPV